MSNIASALGGQFNAHEHDTTDNTQPLAPGDYEFIIEKSKLKPTKAGDGNYVWFQASVTSNPGAGRKVFGRLNIVNKNPEAERIGRADLAKLALAVGLPAIQDTNELIDKCFVGRLKVKDGDNEFAAFKPLGSATTPAPARQATQASAWQAPAAQSAPLQTATQTPAPVAQAAPKRMPWQK